MMICLVIYLMNSMKSNPIKSNMKWKYDLNSDINDEANKPIALTLHLKTAVLNLGYSEHP